jgi:hypothetical protein
MYIEAKKKITSITGNNTLLFLFQSSPHSNPMQVLGVSLFWGTAAIFGFGFWIRLRWVEVDGCQLRREDKRAGVVDKARQGKADTKSNPIPPQTPTDSPPSIPKATQPSTPPSTPPGTHVRYAAPSRRAQGTMQAVTSASNSRARGRSG